MDALTFWAVFLMVVLVVCWVVYSVWTNRIIKDLIGENTALNKRNEALKQQNIKLIKENYKLTTALTENIASEQAKLIARELTPEEREDIKKMWSEANKAGLICSTTNFFKDF